MKSLDTYYFPIKLEQHKTTDVLNKHVNGSLTVIWRDYDNLIKNHPKMVYVSSVNSGEIKGPHIHTKRNSYFTCIHGKVIFILKNNDGTYTATYIAGIKTDGVSITAKTVLYWTGSRRGSLRSVQHPALTFQSARHDYLETGPSVPNCSS